jgi:hypothetical protein
MIAHNEGWDRTKAAGGEWTKRVRFGAIQIQKIFGKNTAFQLCVHGAAKTCHSHP